MSAEIELFRWEDAGDAVLLRDDLVKEWRRRIRLCLQQGRYRIIERATDLTLTYTWIDIENRKTSKTYKTIAVVVRFSNDSDAVFFKLKESEFLGGPLDANAARLGITY